MFTPFVDSKAEPSIHGFLHEPLHPNGNSFVLTHGAGANCQSKLLVELSNALAESGFAVLRFDLPFRQLRPGGPPTRGSAVKDREGIRRALSVMRPKTKGHLFLGGHSYGGRQASILLSEESELVDGLLLLSYPLHPPRKPEELRTAHFPSLKTPSLFVHGTRDSFGSIAEMNSALALIPGAHALFVVEGAGHDLLSKKAENELPAAIVNEFNLTWARWNG